MPLPEIGLNLTPRRTSYPSNSKCPIKIGAAAVRINSTDSSQVTVADGLTVTGATIDFTNLPTSDPGVAGRLFNDSGTVKVSSG